MFGFRRKQQLERDPDILGTLQHILRLERQMAIDFQSFQSQLNDLTTAVQQNNTLVSKLAGDVNAAITALKAQISAGTPVTQDQLDGLSAQVASIKTAVDTANAAIQAEDAVVTPPPAA